MRVVVQRPRTAEGMAALEQRIAEVHAQVIVSSIDSLAWPPEQKRALWAAVKETVKERAEAEQAEGLMAAAGE